MANPNTCKRLPRSAPTVSSQICSYRVFPDLFLPCLPRSVPTVSSQGSVPTVSSQIGSYRVFLDLFLPYLPRSVPTVSRRSCTGANTEWTAATASAAGSCGPTAAYVQGVMQMGCQSDETHWVNGTCKAIT